MNTLQATTLPTEANVINIIFGSQNGLHPLCQSHSSIYLFFSRGRLRSSQVLSGLIVKHVLAGELCIGYQTSISLLVVNGPKRSLL